MKYSILISDFDDTLLRSDMTISKRNIDAINRYRASGGLFTICSGRTFDSICVQMQKLGLGNEDIPILALEGTIIKMSSSKKLLFQDDIDNSLALEIMSKLSDIGVYFHIYIDGQLTVNEFNDLNLRYSQVTSITRNAVGDLIEYVKRNNPRIQKILALSDKDEIEKIEIDMRKTFCDKVDMYISNPMFLEFTSFNAGKGNACKWLANYTRTNIENVVAIGDSMNDFTMIVDVGVGIAVSNAVPRLQEVADYVTVSNDDDAVAVVIDKILDNTLDDKLSF